MGKVGQMIRNQESWKVSERGKRASNIQYPPKGGGGGRSPGEGEYKELFAFSTLKMVQNDDLF